MGRIQEDGFPEVGAKVRFHYLKHSRRGDLIESVKGEGIVVQNKWHRDMRQQKILVAYQGRRLWCMKQNVRLV